LIARIRLQAAPSAVDKIYSRELKPGISLSRGDVAAAFFRHIPRLGWKIATAMLSDLLRCNLATL
jgi:hypothetical protein